MISASLRPRGTISGITIRAGLSHHKGLALSLCQISPRVTIIWHNDSSSPYGGKLQNTTSFCPHVVTLHGCVSQHLMPTPYVLYGESKMQFLAVPVTAWTTTFKETRCAHVRWAWDIENFIRSIHVYTLQVLVSLPQKWPHKKKSSLSPRAWAWWWD